MKIIEDDFAERAILKLINKYKLFKVVVLVNEQTKNSCNFIIDKLFTVVKSVQVVTFPNETKEDLDKAIDKTVLAIKEIVSRGIDSAMNKYNN